MKITLIALPWIFSDKEFKDYEGFSQNLGLGYLGAYAEHHGHSVSIIDSFADGIDRRTEIEIGGKRCYIFGLTAEETTQRIPVDSDFIGISCPFNSQAFMVDIFAAEIKKRFPNVPILLGGPYAISSPKEAALKPNIDIVIIGEGEIPLIDLLSGKNPSDIQGIIFRNNNNEVIDNGLAPVVANMDDLPFPARHLLPMDKYFKRSQRGLSKAKAISITTSRGCPFACEFCALHNLENDYAKRFRARSPENVMKEVDQLIEEYGDIILEFEDDNILILKDRAKKLFSLLSERNVKWAIHSGVMINLIDEEVLIKFKESGCVQLNIALESGNKKILKAMNKPVNLDHALEVVQLCKRLGINTTAFVLVGYPGETNETFQETIEFLKRMKSYGLNAIAPFVVNAHISTPLYEKSMERGYLRNMEGDVMNAGTESICIETESFDEKTVKQWLEMVWEVDKPNRQFIKKSLHKILGTKAFNSVVHTYRDFKKQFNKV